MAQKSHQQARYSVGDCYFRITLFSIRCFMKFRKEWQHYWTKKAASWLLTKAIRYFETLSYVTSDWHSSPGIKLWTQLCTRFTLSFTPVTAWISIVTAAEVLNLCSSLNMHQKSKKRRKQNAEISSVKKWYIFSKNLTRSPKKCCQIIYSLQHEAW